ncbi:hypothetical protein K0M31_017977 [Melipona bicolor]|uniref:Uncharacterized protein n=1 Tax=Melipona bicolor TaxID=60889 RepID=A0AA40FDM4_9HYME|nr:hypothetical protein K0M31_017977 [Melipona bicolor]
MKRTSLGIAGRAGSVGKQASRTQRNPVRDGPMSVTNIPNWKPDSNFDATSYHTSLRRSCNNGQPRTLDYTAPQKSRAFSRFNAELIKRYVIPSIIHRAFTAVS